MYTCQRPCRTVRWINYFFLLLTAVCPGLVNAQSDKPMVFSGYAFAGNFSDRQHLYPHSAGIVEMEQTGYLDELLRARLQAKPQLASRVSMAKADGQTDVNSVAFALVQENVELQKLEGKFWVIIVMQANVLAFNSASKSVVASYPLRMRFTRVREIMPTDSEIKSMVMEAYTSKNPDENIFDQWLNKLDKVKLKSGATKYIRVTDISATPEAEKVMHEAGVISAAIKSQVANLLEAAISEKAGVSIVPNTMGEAIGSKMPIRFANAASFNLTLPVADYAVSFTLRDFVSKRIEKAEYFQDIYRPKANITIKLPDTGKIYVDENVYHTLFVTHPKQARLEIRDWDQYFKTLQGLIAQLATQLANPEDEWLKEHASRALEAKVGFQQTKQLFQELQ